MKLFDYFKREDFGTEYCLALFKFKRRSLIQFSFSWDECPSRPSLILYMGLNSILDIVISCEKFGLCLEFFAPNWTVDSLITDFDYPV